MGSALGRVLGLSNGQTRRLVAAGGAAGIAALFNAPIAGLFFALEVILVRFGWADAVVMFLSSTVASAIARRFYGNAPVFLLPRVGVRQPVEALSLILLGVLAAGIGVVYTRLICWGEDKFMGWRSPPSWSKPAIGGALLGLLAFAYGRVPALSYARMPQVFGVGYQTVEAGLLGQLSLGVMLALMLLKLLATTMTLGSGGSGGVFAPSLFVGSMMGGAWGAVVRTVFPGLAAPTGAYALVGMGAVFAASTRAPVTAIAILFELSGNEGIILPVALAVLVSTLLGRRWLAGPCIYTYGPARRGVCLPADRGANSTIQEV
jgi:CIC family chloride channel protein